MAGKLFILTGPSGVGKTTVAKRLLADVPTLRRLITCTTRPPREGEADGVDYHFFTKDAFLGMISRDELFEWAEVYGNMYGNQTAELEKHLREGASVLMVLDVQGAKSVKEKRPDAQVLFLTAESPLILAKRIQERGGAKPEDLDRRLRELPEEMAFATQAAVTVENGEGQLDQTVAALRAFIEDALAGA